MNKKPIFISFVIACSILTKAGTSRADTVKVEGTSESSTSLSVEQSKTAIKTSQPSPAVVSKDLKKATSQQTVTSNADREVKQVNNSTTNSVVSSAKPIRQSSEEPVENRKNKSTTDMQNGPNLTNSKDASSKSQEPLSTVKTKPITNKKVTNSLSDQSKSNYKMEGNPIKINRYASVIRKNYSIWQNFNWDRHTAQVSEKYYRKTVKINAKYLHQNGKIYYSINDNKGWLGFINYNAIKLANGPQGIGYTTKQYVSVNKKNYKIWQDLKFQKSNGMTSQRYQNTFQSRRQYLHFNGFTYDSLYNGKNQWQGYVNQNTLVKTGIQGIKHVKNDQAVIVKGNYSIWKNFAWKKKQNSYNLMNQKFHIGSYYHHFNSNRYYGLYLNNGKFFGYINAKAVKLKITVSKFLNVTNKAVNSELTKHSKDNYYLGTIYRGLSTPSAERVMSPNGHPNRFGAGMNCTGFVASVLKNVGANINRITKIANAWGGLGNAYNWRDALSKNVATYTFNSISALLKSKIATQGDIIYFDPNWNEINYDCHIGIYWGSEPGSNKFWHSASPMNKISNIYCPTQYSKVYLFKM